MNRLKDLGAFLWLAAACLGVLLPVSIRWRMSWRLDGGDFYLWDLLTLAGGVLLILGPRPFRIHQIFAVLGTVAAVGVAIALGVPAIRSCILAAETFFVFCCLGYFPESDMWRRIVTVSLGIVFLGLILQIGLYGFAGVQYTRETGEGVGQSMGELARIRTTAGSPTATGFTVLFCAWIIAFVQRRSLKIFVLMLVLGIVAAACTFSRGSVAVGIMMLLVVIATDQRIKISNVKGLMAGTAIAGCMVVVGLLFGDRLLPAVEARLAGVSESDDGRRDFAARAVRSIEKNPLVGVGLGEYARRERMVYSCELSGREFRPSPHNSHLLLTAEGGFPVYLLWIGTLGVFLIYKIPRASVFRIGGFCLCLGIAFCLEIIFLQTPLSLLLCLLMSEFRKYNDEVALYN